jgi:hypothetical protein
MSLVINAQIDDHLFSQNLQESPEIKSMVTSQKFDTRPLEKSPNVALNQA